MFVVVVVVVSHFQRIGCQPEKTTLLHGGQSRSFVSCSETPAKCIYRYLSKYVEVTSNVRGNQHVMVEQYNWLEREKYDTLYCPRNILTVS